MSEIERDYNIDSFGPTRDLYDVNGRRVYFFENGTYVKVANATADDMANYGPEVEKLNARLQKLYNMDKAYD